MYQIQDDDLKFVTTKLSQNLKAKVDVVRQFDIQSDSVEESKGLNPIDMKTYSENALQEERKSGAEFHEPAFRVSVTQKILLI